MSSSRFLVLSTLATLLVAIAPAEDRFATFLSGPGASLYVGAGLLLPFARDGSRGGMRSLRAVDALATTVILTEGLKQATHVPRPGTREHDSFPSGHASAVFCLATMMSDDHPNETPYWYLGAALIADSRLTLGRHRPADVFAGAALGYLTARAELSAPRGLLISPFVPGPRSAGVLVGMRF